MVDPQVPPSEDIVEAAAEFAAEHAEDLQEEEIINLEQIQTTSGQESETESPESEVALETSDSEATNNKDPKDWEVFSMGIMTEMTQQLVELRKDLQSIFAPSALPSVSEPEISTQDAQSERLQARRDRRTSRSRSHSNERRSARKNEEEVFPENSIVGPSLGRSTTPAVTRPEVEPMVKKLGGLKKMDTTAEVLKVKAQKTVFMGPPETSSESDTDDEGNLTGWERTKTKLLVRSPVPKAFAKYPTMQNRNRWAELKSYFPDLGALGKFNGLHDSTPDGCKIVDILTSATTAQKVIMLSEMEFRCQLRKQFSGPALVQIENCYAEGKSLRDTYAVMEQLYYQGATPDKAQQQLDALSLRTAGFSTFQEARIRVSHLCTLASYKMVNKKDRTAHRNDNFRKTFKRLVPRELRSVIETDYNRTAAQMGGDLSINCYSQLLTQYASLIDEVYQEKKGREESGVLNRRNYRAQVKLINAGSEEEELEEAPAQASKKVALTNTPPAPRQAYTGRGRRDNSGQNARKSSRPLSAGNAEGITLPARPGTKCAMCWSDGHTTENCPNYPAEMRVPTTEPCGTCKQGNHPAPYCHIKRTGKNF